MINTKSKLAVTAVMLAAAAALTSCSSTTNDPAASNAASDPVQAKIADATTAYANADQQKLNDMMCQGVTSSKPLPNGAKAPMKVTTDQPVTVTKDNPTGAGTNYSDVIAAHPSAKVTVTTLHFPEHSEAVNLVLVDDGGNVCVGNPLVIVGDAG